MVLAQSSTSGADEPPLPGIRLRHGLLLLTAAAILPLAAMTGLGLVALARQQRSQAQRVGLELARSVATAIDAELRSSIGVLEALATAATLERGDLPAFRERARKVVDLRPAWAAIVLARPDGTPLVDTRFAPGSPLPPIADRESFARVVGSRVPVVGSLAQDTHGDWLFAVRVPVVRDGQLRHVLTALVEPEAIRGILVRQRAPEDWVVSIVDAHSRRVARSRAHEANVGGRLSPSVEAIVAQGGAEGFGVAYSLEGERIFTPYSRLSPSGWRAVLGIPTGLVDTAMWRSLAVYGGGLLLSLTLGTLAALRVARSISRPIAELRAAGEALGRHEVPATPETPIREIRDVGAALHSAAEALQRGEAERDDLLRKEREARQAAESADRAKEEFLAVLSHELRTPLNAVYGWARMLQSGEAHGEGLLERAMDAIVRNANVQVQLIDDLLDLSRITTGKMRIDIRAVDLESVVQAALDAVRPAAEAKGIRVVSDLGEGVGPVTGDPERLQQVVWNVLMNAVKFTPRGGRVDVRLRRAVSQADIVVSDTGKGVPADLLPHVFERFRQGDSSSTRAHGGLGLGLALVKHLVELHGGTVRADSAGENRGATFVVSLPVAVAEIPLFPSAPVVAGALPAGPPRGGARLDGLRVLTVDDHADAGSLVHAILTAAGAEVQSCLGAAEGLEVLRRWRPDVLVSDIEMPDEDGYAFIAKIRALAADEGGATPAIALTAYGRTQDRVRTLDAGYSMHVPKPVDPGELTSIIASVVGRPLRPQAPS
jgi:signal transduction histidine kinase/ActR/RegA family two-component response regulator